MSDEKIIDEEGHFHVEDEAVDLSGTIVEGWAALAIFWALGLTVFYQFVTRYVLNDSAAWTEEVARYLLIGVVFVGAAIGVAKNLAIQVDFFYRYLPPAVGRWMSRLVDALRIAFFAAAVVLTGQMMPKLGSPTRMTIVDAPMNIVYGVVLLGFVALTFRSIQVAMRHWRRGYSVLERPMTPSPTPRRRPMLKIIFLLFMSSGLPVAIAMAGASLVYILISGNLPPFVVIHRMVGGIDSFPLLAVPFFILAGNLMNNAGITTRIYDFALALVGWLKGGLGHVNVVGSVIFAGMSGTAIADAAGLGTIEIKAMQEHGYPTEFAVGVTAASATLGPIIPPSLPFVIYGMMANVSVGALFLAGILPGLLMAMLMMLTVAFYAHRSGWGRDVKFSSPRF